MTLTQANAAIFYVPEAFSTAGPRLMGRYAAGESFLRGWIRHANVDRITGFVPDVRFGGDFAATVCAVRKDRGVELLNASKTAELGHVGTLFYPTPGIGQLAWQRRWMAERAWSLVGITHTTASTNAMDAIIALTTSPVHPWDALICTSRCVAATVETVLAEQLDFLASRLGGRPPPLPQFPVIPIGIHCDDFAFDAGDRAEARASLGADDRTHVVLFTGRLSFHAKAHPLAMYLALEKAASALPRDHRVMLVECGWFANEPIRAAFQQAQRQACPSIEVRHLDGRSAAARNTAWAAADVFCSLSDNIQETFGLVPIEAMAGGLPVVVSDWDGYKDTVRDGIDGFRVPTVAPAAGMVGQALSRELELGSYDRYCGEAAMMVAVDIEASTAAFARLFADPQLRHRLGTAGRERARTCFDWSVIVPRYQELFSRLGEIRCRQPSTEGGQPWPARLDPFRAFSSYPTMALAPDMRLVAGPLVENMEKVLQLAVVSFPVMSKLSEQEQAAISDRLARGGATVREICSGVPPDRQPYFLAGVLRLAKVGIIRILAGDRSERL